NQKIREINQINASLENTVNERTAALVAKEQESRTLIENSPDSIARYDRECRRIYANPAFCAMTGCSLEQLLGKRPSENPGGADAELYESKLREVLATGRNTQFELKWLGNEGKDVCSHVRLTAEVDLTGKPSTVLAIGRDISDRIAFETTIWQQANFDALTQLPNRQMFHDRLVHEAQVSDRSGRPMALMLIDLDRFKEINDTLGHDKGDILLVEAAKRIAACVRKSDTVARLGGDEFTVILSSLDDKESIERVAQTINEKLADPFLLGTDEAFISASIGITLYPDDSRDLDVLFKNADQAMYVAKNAGRNRFSYFTPDLQEAALTRLRLTNDLRAAMTAEQFQVYYQPIVDLASGEICKAEALIRWHHPEYGTVSPVEFVPLAEETGLIVPIGDWVFRQAVQQVRQWRSRFHKDFQISINKSPVQIRHDDAAFSQWPEYLAQHGMPGQSVVIEITEGLLLNAEAKINEKLLAFRDAGIQVSIDDFGTGYSSLAYLKRFDIDYLKIDRSFVHNLNVDADDQALCEAIIVMAHRLGLKVIAEGVETTDQRDLLIAAGCDFAQGYFYSEPLPPDQFERWAWPNGW
ncbi:MAG: EAL domain-containing protein, partial [Betaproteobacteria bacterium]|nr:EAL domain-containing protein [Betaproteobacteria bacterium]